MPGLGLRHRACSGAVIALACAVSACGHASTASRHRTLRLVLTEYRIDPQSARASAGRLTIIVHNYGRRTHNLVLSLNGQSAGATKPIWPGASTKITIYLVHGTYQMTSTILSDEALGEYGTLVVS